MPGLSRYVYGLTLPIKPILGQTVAIHLTGPSVVAPPEMWEVEVSEQGDPIAGTGNPGLTTLRFAEVEFYEAPPER